MQVGPGQVGKGAASSPTRMEQGFVMPATCGAYDESLYRTQQPVPPSTPSSSSRNQGKGSNGTPEQETSSGNQQQQGVKGMPPFGGKGNGDVPEGFGFGSCGAQMQGKGFQGPCFQPPGFFQPSGGPQMFGGVPGAQNQMFGGVPSSQNQVFGVAPGAQSQAFGPQASFPSNPVVPGMPLFQGNSQGPMLGGMTPQAQRMQHVLSMSQGLSSNQLLTLMQSLQEQMRSQARLNPEQFGDVPIPQPSTHSAVPDLDFSRDGVHIAGGSDGSQIDAFSKSEKWLGTPPKPNFDSWNTREGEVIGWSQFLIDLASWAAQASIEFSLEIQQCARWHSPIVLDGMPAARRARAMRLNAILKSTMQDHARTSNLISAFGEGVSLDESSVGLNLQQLGNGFELLRQLTVEFSLRTRAEALAIRTQFASRSFVLSGKETSTSSVVSDVVRRIDLEAARFSKLLATLPSSIDAVGLQLSDADLLMILMRSLPDAVKSYTIHHSLGENYQSYRAAARRWEMQQRMFLEQMNAGGGRDRRVHEVATSSGAGAFGESSPTSTEWFSIGDDYSMVDAVSPDKCQKCGSRKHSTSSCHIDLSKTKCFRCQQFGHVGMNCPSGKEKGSHGSPSSGKGKGKVNKGGHWDKGKGKSKKGKGSKGFGKKGKLNQVGSSDDDWWWYADDWASDWNDADGSWNVDQVEWGDWGWYDWSQYETETSHDSPKDTKPEPSNEGKQDSTVGSLVIHALFGEDFSR